MILGFACRIRRFQSSEDDIRNHRLTVSRKTDYENVTTGNQKTDTNTIYFNDTCPSSVAEYIVFRTGKRVKKRILLKPVIAKVEPPKSQPHTKVEPPPKSVPKSAAKVEAEPPPKSVPQAPAKVESKSAAKVEQPNAEKTYQKPRGRKNTNTEERQDLCRILFRILLWKIKSHQ